MAEEAKSYIKQFVECKESTLNNLADSTKDESLGSTDAFAQNSISAIDNCLAIAPLAKAEAKDKFFLIDAIESSEKRMNTEKTLYKMMINTDKTEISSTQNNKDMAYVNFAIATVKQNEIGKWSRSRLYESTPLGSINPYNYWTGALIFMVFLFFLKYLALKSQKQRKKP